MKVGQRVICIDDSKLPHTIEELNNDVPNWVTKGTIYTIREIMDHDFVVSILLSEIYNTPKFFKSVNKVLEPGFKISRFRELKEDEVMVDSREMVVES